ncbi:MAG TPA: transaldolase [Jiangellaceae bacterium]
MSEPLRALSAQGVAIWLDDLSRDRIQTGNLQSLVDDKHVVGITTNPTIFQTAISKSSLYDDHINAAAAAGEDADAAVRRLTTDDVRSACDLLAPVAAHTVIDGRVSIEVEPRLAYDTGGTIEQAHDLWTAVGRKNLFVKIPATREGLPAITSCIADGISVNVTLIFAIERYREVMDAYLAGLEQRLDAGKPLSGIESVASFFVSRVDTEVDKRLETIGTEEALALRGKAAIANARLAYAAFEEVVESERWQRLEEAGASRQRPLWASTSVKNPEYSDTMYVTELVAPGTVNTMPESTLEAVADHGVIAGDTVTPNYDHARAIMAALADIGIDMADVTRTLEREGVDKFATSWNDLLASVEAKLEAVR